jgi:hypothetical protein
MPHVRKADVLGVVRQLWSSGTIEDEAKLILVRAAVAAVPGSVSACCLSCGLITASYCWITGRKAHQ